MANLESGTAMNQAVEALRAQLMDANVRLASPSWGDPAAKQALYGNLEQYGKKITDLDTRMRNDVVNGALTIDKWMAVARSTSEGVSAVAGYNITFGNFYSDVIAKTASDVTEKASNAIDALPDSSALPYYLAAGIAVLVLILAIKVT